MEDNNPCKGFDRSNQCMDYSNAMNFFFFCMHVEHRFGQDSRNGAIFLPAWAPIADVAISKRPLLFTV